MRMSAGRMKETAKFFCDTIQDWYRAGYKFDLKNQVRADERKSIEVLVRHILAMGHQMQKARFCVTGQTICAAHARRKRFD